MSERTTGELESALRRMLPIHAFTEEAETIEAAAGRLAELDAELAQLRTEGAELVAELFTPPESAVRYGETIYVDQPSALMARLNDLYQKARDQKLGLDALTIIEARGAVEMYAIIDALRPPCPRGCDDGVFHEERMHAGGDVADIITGTCPENGGDCDGKVSIEQLVATYNAVQTLRPIATAWLPCLDYLRSVKPNG